MTRIYQEAAARLPANARTGAKSAPASDDQLLREPETCCLTGLALRTLQRMRVEGYGPPYVRLGRRVLYRMGDLRKWIADNSHTSTSAETVATKGAR